MDHRCSALSLVDAFTVQTNLLKEKKKRCWAVLTRSPLTADVPDQFKRLSAQRGGLMSVLASYIFSKVIIGNAFGCVL